MDIVAGRTAKHKRGPKKSDLFLRDIVIAVTVFRVAQKFGLKYTRNRSSPRPSACSIVARAFPMLDEAGVRAIWSKYGASDEAFLRSIIAENQPIKAPYFQ